MKTPQPDKSHADVPGDNDSAFITDGNAAGEAAVGDLFSNRLTDIRLLYSSPCGPVEIHTATRYGKRYILKGLQESYRDNPLCNMALAKEFEIGLQLDHPNIRRTIGMDDVDGAGKVIVLEYVDGYTLTKRLSDPGLTLTQGRAIAAQIADALAYLHSKQIFHRDLKPANILVAHNGNVVKVIDFSLSDSDEFVIFKNPAGTRRYMAPELFDSNAKPTAVADIYSFGILISEIAQATGDDALADAARRCTDARPERRPQSMAAVKLPPVGITAADRVSKALSSATTTWILIAVIAAVGAFIIFMLTNTL